MARSSLLPSSRTYSGLLSVAGVTLVLLPRSASLSLRLTSVRLACLSDLAGRAVRRLSLIQFFAFLLASRPARWDPHPRPRPAVLGPCPVSWTRRTELDPTRVFSLTALSRTHLPPSPSPSASVSPFHQSYSHTLCPRLGLPSPRSLSQPFIRALNAARAP
ncbi:uncharacterized protein PSFLO_01623 [Pseudozyma flocculosa]|uniref:Uncharacterized protein n=1 Tax=Pseudozyma flocculosa TaxID=84751 RepID=A0A5C3EVS9_9BASI|nr:uncharacterized protein PSFLO_01623 [Pseudozyma flocculosa]